MFLNNRYHDPTLGTFISVDPLVAQTGEAYIYASGNPTTHSDPTGLCTYTSGTLYCGANATEIEVEPGYHDTTGSSQPPPSASPPVFVQQSVEEPWYLPADTLISALQITNDAVDVGTQVCGLMNDALHCGVVQDRIPMVGNTINLADAGVSCVGATEAECADAIVSGSFDFIVYRATRGSLTSGVLVTFATIELELLMNAIGALQLEPTGGWQFNGEFDDTLYYDAWYPDGVYRCGGTVSPHMGPTGNVCVP